MAQGVRLIADSGDEVEVQFLDGEFSFTVTSSDDQDETSSLTVVLDHDTATLLANTLHDMLPEDESS